MTDERRGDEHADPSPKSEGPQTEEIRHSPVGALVPERVSRGVFSTGAVVVQGTHEFIIDFLLRMTAPQQLAARVVLSPGVMGQLISALRENLNNYEKKFGPPMVPQAPGVTAQPPSAPPQGSVQDLYEQLKLPEDVLSGNYANAVIIGHTGSEFCFDFITTFYPRSAVSCRVYLSAPSIPRFLESLKHSHEKYLEKLGPRRPEAQQNPQVDES
jgi:hypothetical protein